jgi:hypothetical protein
MDLSCNHFDNYSFNYEYLITNMTMITIKGNYDYTTNVTILKQLLDLVSTS